MRGRGGVGSHLLKMMDVKWFVYICRPCLALASGEARWVERLALLYSFETAPWLYSSTETVRRASVCSHGHCSLLRLCITRTQTQSNALFFFFFALFFYLILFVRSFIRPLVYTDCAFPSFFPPCVCVRVAAGHHLLLLLLLLEDRSAFAPNFFNREIKKHEKKPSARDPHLITVITIYL